MCDGSPAFDAVVPAPFGAIGVRASRDLVTAIDLCPRVVRVKSPRTDAGRAAVRFLEAYLEDPRAVADGVPIGVQGTAFQRRAWQNLRVIPPGAQMSYGELAAKLGTSPRAVGGACRANPVPIIVPCHRVVAARGGGGFMGETRGPAMEIKTWLLAHEAGEAGRGRR
ncbi:MAG: methylated-DNA--[protein]-cysteine S-methyltransferase [Gammaproteobacteria bacterium]|nr:methylated-DNA--[protein]-cysteine S-methyltransferase [Gammaproteobacteria bacterium]